MITRLNNRLYNYLLPSIFLLLMGFAACNHSIPQDPRDKQISIDTTKEIITDHYPTGELKSICEHKKLKPERYIISVFGRDGAMLYHDSLVGVVSESHPDNGIKTEETDKGKIISSYKDGKLTCQKKYRPEGNLKSIITYNADGGYQEQAWYKTGKLKKEIKKDAQGNTLSKKKYDKDGQITDELEDNEN